MRFIQRLKAALREERGQGLVEYSLILAFISTVAVGTLSTMGADIGLVLTRVSGLFPH